MKKLSKKKTWYRQWRLEIRQRPYHVENTSSRLITEVKQHRAQSVLGWVTSWEHWVLLSVLVFFSGTKWDKILSKERILRPYLWQRPYHVENTSSRPITEVKQRWARLVLGWVTAWEHRVLLSFLSFSTLLPRFPRKFRMGKKIEIMSPFRQATFACMLIWGKLRQQLLPVNLHCHCQKGNSLHRPGIEPGPPAWQASILPLNQRC